MLMSPEQEALIGRVFDSYLTEHHQEDIVQILEDTNEETHRAVVVNAMTLFEANMEVMSAQYKTPSTGYHLSTFCLQKECLIMWWMDIISTVQ